MYLKGTIELTRDQLRALVHYDPATGHFTWLPRTQQTSPHLTDPRSLEALKKWNGTYAGKRAGTTRRRYIGNSVYEFVQLSIYKEYKANKLAWYYMRGEWVSRIWHKDSDQFNLVYDNLTDSDPELAAAPLKMVIPPPPPPG